MLDAHYDVLLSCTLIVAWKTVRLVLLKKESWQVYDPSVLCNLRKVMETLQLSRLKIELEDIFGFHAARFGFHEG